MTSYLQKHNQRLEARSRSIEAGREKENPGYMKFLEEQISKFNQREAEFDRMQAKLIDIQTKFDKLLSQENKLETETSIRSRTLSKVEEKVKILEGLAERVEFFEKQSLGRFVAFEAKVSARLNKLERDVELIPTLLRDQMKRSTHELNSSFDKNSGHAGMNASGAKDKRKNKSLRFQASTEQTCSASDIALLREEFNIKLQALMDELQCSVLYKDYDRKCVYFEEKMANLKNMITAAQTSQSNASGSSVPAPVLDKLAMNARNSQLEQEVRESRGVFSRLERLEDTTNHLKVHFEQLLNLFEREKVRSRSGPREYSSVQREVESPAKKLEELQQANLMSTGTQDMYRTLATAKDYRGYNSNFSSHNNMHQVEDEMDVDREEEADEVRSNHAGYYNPDKVNDLPIRPATGGPKKSKKKKLDSGKAVKSSAIIVPPVKEYGGKPVQRERGASTGKEPKQNNKNEDRMPADDSAKVIKTNKDKIRALLGKQPANTTKK